MNPATTIEIAPVSIWTSTGVVQANRFEVRYVSYSIPTAVADCHLWADDGVNPAIEVKSSLVHATAEQCALWTDDFGFFATLAANSGLVAVGTATLPVIALVMPVPPVPVV